MTKMVKARGFSYDVDQPMLDITQPIGPVQIVQDFDRGVLWVNVDGVCVLRICRITDGFTYDKLGKQKVVGPTITDKGVTI